jgi:hypothetical protein
MMATDLFVGVIVPLVGANPDDSWHSGPLALPIPVNEGTRAGSAKVTDVAARRDMFTDIAAASLYPSNGIARAHRVESLEPLCQNLPAPVAAELVPSVRFMEEPGAAFLLLHFLVLGDQPLVDLSSIVRGCSRLRVEWLGGLGLGATPRPAGRVIHLAHLTWDSPLPALDVVPGWDRTEEWLYYLAAASTPAQIVPDGHKQSLLSERLRLSADWSGLVLRDGLALAATSTRDVQFHLSARVYARSIYLDALLLALIQKLAAQELNRKVAAEMETPNDLTASGAERLEEEFLRFRSLLWGSHPADRGGTIDEIVRRAHDQHRLPALVEKLTSDLQDISRFIQSRVTRRREQRGFLIAVISAVFLVPSLVFTMASMLAAPSVAAFAWCSAITVVAWIGIAGGIGIWRQMSKRSEE